MIGRIAGLVLFTFMIVPTAMAEPIPIEQLKKDFTECVASCPAEWGEPACTNFCRCMNAGVQRDFTYEEYQNLVTGFSTDAVADTALVGRFLDIRKVCEAGLPQSPAPQ